MANRSTFSAGNASAKGEGLADVVTRAEGQNRQQRSVYRDAYEVLFVRGESAPALDSPNGPDVFLPPLARPGHFDKTSIIESGRRNVH